MFFVSMVTGGEQPDRNDLVSIITGALIEDRNVFCFYGNRWGTAEN